MKKENKNPLFTNAKLEESYCKYRMYKCLHNAECEITLRPQGIFYEEDGKMLKRKDVSIFIGNDTGTIETELVLTTKEAREFANYILELVDAMEKESEAE